MRGVGAGAAAEDQRVEQRVGAEAVAAVDTTGCGDAFCSVMAAALARGFTLDRAIAAAQKAAALTATRPGAFAALPSRAELAAIL